MKINTEVLGYNFAIILLLNVVSRAIGKPYNNGAEHVAFWFLATPALILINLILSIIFFILKKKDLGLSYIIALLMVGLLGFGSCFLGVVKW